MNTAIISATSCAELMISGTYITIFGTTYCEMTPAETIMAAAPVACCIKEI